MHGVHCIGFVVVISIRQADCTILIDNYNYITIIILFDNYINVIMLIRMHNIYIYIYIYI